MTRGSLAKAQLLLELGGVHAPLRVTVEIVDDLQDTGAAEALQRLRFTPV